MDDVASNSGRVGQIIVVVGPSGAGKDSLINHAALHYQNHSGVQFVRRVITRNADGATEDHDTATAANFARLNQDGSFAVTWRAHGLQYGIPAEYRSFVSEGGIAVCNGSRSALPLFREEFGRLTVVNVTARPDILAARLEARGRETREDIARRLARSTMDVQGDFDVITLDNSSSIEAGGDLLIDLIEDSFNN